MLPETHPQLKARCRGPSTLSTKVDEETKEWVRRIGRRAEVPPSEVVRRLLDYYREHTAQVNREVGL